ncbi:DUF1289 domain-containing protein [Ideonella sp.]|uniref:DUF1289 domain-containing protein n=1 Tax=Ideonella sp. TaxID=1929293 RepID=UPI0035B38299
MSTAASAAGGVPSPCTSVCRIDPRTGWCAGCARTLDEIAAWSRLDDDAKRRVWALLPQRRATTTGTGAPGPAPTDTERP